MKKISKEEADYKPSTGPRKCGSCSMYDKGTCSLVSGTIQASYVCKYWRQGKSAKK